MGLGGGVYAFALSRSWERSFDGLAGRLGQVTIRRNYSSRPLSAGKQPPAPGGDQLTTAFTTHFTRLSRDPPAES